MTKIPLNLFYQEPDLDRWFPFDRYPRKIIRRLVRGKVRPGGQMMVYLNLIDGLEKLQQSYRFNDFAYIEKHPNELACIIGKPEVLLNRHWQNPVLFGASIFSHPIDYANLFEQYPVKKILVPGEWMRQMFEPYYGSKVLTWPVGIDTDKWYPSALDKTTDILLYDKVRWEHPLYEKELINPILNYLKAKGLKVEILRYGYYQPIDFQEILKRSKAVIFLCEHETQGLAYQQALSMNIPILAWDRGGYWQDPSHFPHRVKFSPVSSVPYWDGRCGIKFADQQHFKDSFEEFWTKVQANYFNPREYILENLTLEKCAQEYINIVQSIS